MMPDDLPPQPDPWTGDPRPPYAPRNFGYGQVTPANKQPRRGCPVPEELGPVLEWNRALPLHWGGRPVLFLVLAVVLTIVAAHGSPLVPAWLVWLAWSWFVAFSVLSWWLGRDRWIAAGATWLWYGTQWLDSYDLATVVVWHVRRTQWLKLVDSSGRELRYLKLSWAQSNDPLWDLLYNGILHSVVSGKANPSGATREILSLPEAAPAQP